MGIAEVAYRFPAEISPGMQRRVALARALCLAPSILTADEPTTGLDPKAARSVNKALLQLTDEGVTLVVVTHDLRSIQMLQPRLTWVHDKKARFAGGLDDSLPEELQKILQL
ncbi:MAG: ATP-binding cassette domain-containing protein [Deltaproteobacteria bacterium]|nr:ATP-binding cassette domain-containing protein [Deltaproteobacteria bacterium]